jgi:ribosome-associated protein
LEARAGIEPACTDLQSATSPLRHRAKPRTLRGSGALATNPAHFKPFPHQPAICHNLPTAPACRAHNLALKRDMPRIAITRAISLDESELVETTTRASGPGGQHVNTTDSAVILKFDIASSPSLPDAVKYRLAKLAGSRLTSEGVVVLRSEGSRSQLANRQEVRERLIAMIVEATFVPKARKATKPTKASQKRRVEGKVRRASVKAGRGKWQE